MGSIGKRVKLSVWAKRHGLTPRSARQMLSFGRLPAELDPVKIGRHWYVREVDGERLQRELYPKVTIDRKSFIIPCEMEFPGKCCTGFVFRQSGHVCFFFCLLLARHVASARQADGARRPGFRERLWLAVPDYSLGHGCVLVSKHSPVYTTLGCVSAGYSSARNNSMITMFRRIGASIRSA